MALSERSNMKTKPQSKVVRVYACVSVHNQS